MKKVEPTCLPPTFGKILFERQVGKCQLAFDFRYAFTKDVNNYDLAELTNVKKVTVNTNK